MEAHIWLYFLIPLCGYYATRMVRHRDIPRVSYLLYPMLRNEVPFLPMILGAVHRRFLRQPTGVGFSTSSLQSYPVLGAFTPHLIAMTRECCTF